MYDNRLFQDGIHSALLVEWTLHLETPLLVHTGEKLGYAEVQAIKTRNQGLQLHWYDDANLGNEVAALAYEYSVDGGTAPSLTMRHIVPASSVRGALRAWTVRHLLDGATASQLMPVAKESVDGQNQEDAAEAQANWEKESKHRTTVIKRALDDDATGAGRFVALFGFAVEHGEEELRVNAGRLQVETEPFDGTGLRNVDVGGASMNSSAGPENAKRQMTVRNPLDRISHASFEGGLHHFLEFARGQTFTMRLRILNPTPADLKIVSAWRSEIEAGMIRFGALASIGRGRVSIQDENCTLLNRASHPLASELANFPTSELDASEPLFTLWEQYTVPLSASESHEMTNAQKPQEGAHAPQSKPL